MEKITVDTIIEYIKEQVENKQPLAPSVWLDAAGKLNALKGDEYGKLFTLQHTIAQKKLAILKGQEKRNVSEAKLEVEAMDEYRDYLIQKSKCDQIEEYIRIAKLNARVEMNEMH